MASLNTGSGNISQRVDPGLVDPRLLGADLSRIGQGIGQGMGLVNDYYAAKENAAMRPIRRGLADMQLAAAQEQAALAPDRRALAALQLASLQEQAEGAATRKAMTAIALEDAQRKAAINAVMPTLLDETGVYTKGGDFLSPSNTYSDQETGVVQQVRLPSGEVVTRNKPMAVISGKDVAIKAADRANKQANEAARLQVLKDKVEVEREKLEAQVAKLDSAGNKNLELKELTTSDGGVAIGIIDKRTGEWTSDPKVIPGAIATKFDPLSQMFKPVGGDSKGPRLPAYDIKVMPEVITSVDDTPSTGRGLSDLISPRAQAKPSAAVSLLVDEPLVTQKTEAKEAVADADLLAAAQARIRGGAGIAAPAKNNIPEYLRELLAPSAITLREAVGMPEILMPSRTTQSTR